MKWQFLVGGAFLLILVVFVFVVNAPSAPAPTQAEWDKIRAADIPVFSSEWGTPVRLAVSDAGWEDSLFVTPDGQRVYFAYYSGDLIGDFASRKFVDDLDMYYSDAPFTSKIKDTRFHLSEDIWSEVGPMLTDSGDYFYNSNRDYLNDKKADTDVWMNNERLAFNDAVADSEYGNPHYDESTDTLWMDELDQRMWVLKNAKANNFSGTPEPAPSPIQVDGYSNFQPWLSANGKTILFSTNRGDIPGINGPAIYLSTRSEAGEWASPQLIAYSKTGLGEATMTADGKRLFFIQLFSDGKGNHTTDMFYVEKKA